MAYNQAHLPPRAGEESYGARGRALRSADRMRPNRLKRELIALTLVLALAAPALAARKVAFAGCLAKHEDAELGDQISDSLEQRLLRAGAPDFEFVPDAVSKARASLKGGPVNPDRIAQAGRAMGADEVVVCLITYKRERAATVTGEAKTTTLKRDVTEYVEEEYYVDVPNPDYEPPMSANIPVGRAGPVTFFVTVGEKAQPRTIREKHVRRVPQTKTLSTEYTEPGEETEKPGYVRLRAGYLIMDAATRKVLLRDTVSYVNELAAMWDSMETDKDVKSKAADSVVDGLEHGILAKLPAATGK